MTVLFPLSALQILISTFFIKLFNILISDEAKFGSNFRFLIQDVDSLDSN